MKKIISLLLIILFLTGCSESFLDTKNLTQTTTSNFPKNPADANQLLTGIYSVLPSFGGFGNILLLSELMSDDRFGGGGQNDRAPEAINVFRVTGENEHSNAWGHNYKGIFRCNSLLSALDNVEVWESEEQKKRVIGETSFLRAMFYFNLARLFGSVPMLLKTDPENLPKASADELYGQIALDLKTAIDNLPNVAVAQSEFGRATKWAAEAYMARVFLFYTGYYQKAEIVLPEEGGSISKQQVIGWVDDCIANSGHSLVPDFRNLWTYSISQDTYGYAKDNNLQWVGDEGGNTEAVFSVIYAPLISTAWGEMTFHSNQVNLFCGMREGTAQVPFARGWGFAPVNPKLYLSWLDDDIRKQGSILKVDDPSEGIDEYVWGADMQWQETGYFGKKYVGINVLDTDGKKRNYSVSMYNTSDNFMINNAQNVAIIRLSDVYLMGAELGSSKAQEYMDIVRDRVNLPSVPATLENIKLERRHELAFEGVRYFDVLRWHGSGAGTILKQNMDGATIYNMTVETTINQDRGQGFFDLIDQRINETGGFLMIPNNEIQLSQGVLEQNSGWTVSGDIMF